MAAKLLLFALFSTVAVQAQITSTTPTGPGAFDPLDGAAAPTATVTITISPTLVSTCDTLTVQWDIENSSSDVDITPSTFLVTNMGVSQSGDVSSYSPPPIMTALGLYPLSRQQFSWFVFLTDPGYYVVNASVTQGNPPPVIVQSERFLLQPGDTSCLPSSSSSSMQETSTPPPSLSSPTDSIILPVSTPKSNMGAIIGGTVAGIVVLILAVGFWFIWRRRRNTTHNVGSLTTVGSRSGSGKGHQRNWGGLSSIDKLQQGEIPVVMPSNSPYVSPDYNRTRSQSTGHAMTEEEGMEKGYSKETFPVDADLLSEMPTLDSNRASRRYSSDMLQRHAYSDPRGVAVPVLTTTSATSHGSEDPFADTTFITRVAKRTSGLSVPSTARADSRVSDISTHVPLSPSPIPGPNPPFHVNTMTRNTSATPTPNMGRPSRKPVPQYSDDSFELTNTNKSSPTSHSPLTPVSLRSPHRSNTDKTSGSGSKAHSTSPSDSSSHWLHERAPVANRNIGLAGQGDGPVHYLMPDLPPPARG